MRFIFAFALCFLALVQAKQLHHEATYQKMFTNFVSTFNKEYEHDAFFARYNIFKANYDIISAHNAGNSSFTMGVNQFADMTPAEFKAQYTGYRPIDRSFTRALNVNHNLHAKFIPQAAAVDWRQKNAVTPVKNQGQCGSCWAFSTTGSTEGAVALKTGTLVSLSEQQLVECSAAQGNQGCNGGLMDSAFQYIITNGGICSEAAYPYTSSGGTSGTCASSKCTSVATISSFTDVAPNNEAALLQAVTNQPVSIAIEADQAVFQYYTGGVLDDASCGTTLDHGVLIVGYGTDAASSKDYWIVKNSWGASWGESGYIRMVRNKNQCGLATDPSYPVA